MAILNRAGVFLFLYLLASLSIFLAVEAIPGDPVELRFGKVLDPQRVALERERLGLDAPAFERYLHSQKQFLSGDWGRSLSSGRTTLEDVAQHLPATLELSLCAMVLGTAFGLACALYAALSERQWIQGLAAGIGSIGLLVPIFWIGILLLLVFSLWLGWFPTGGRYDLALSAPARISGLLLADSLLSGNLAAFYAAARHLALPASCLAVFPAASVSAVAFARLKEPEIQALVVALRSRGYSPARILWRHLLRLAAGPVITVTGTSFGALLGGAFLTETVFSWPGAGRYLVGAILGRDIFVSQNLLQFLVLLTLAVAFVSDLATRLMEPRSREVQG